MQAASALYTMPNYSQSTHGQTSTHRQTFTDRQTDTLITILRSPIGGGVITRDDSSNGAIELSWRRQRGEGGSGGNGVLSIIEDGQLQRSTCTYMYQHSDNVLQAFAYQKTNAAEHPESVKSRSHYINQTERNSSFEHVYSNRLDNRGKQMLWTV